MQLAATGGIALSVIAILAIVGVVAFLLKRKLNK